MARKAKIVNSYVKRGRIKGSFRKDKRNPFKSRGKKR